MTLTSPLFHTSDPTPWQKHVEMTWTYLRKHYQIQGHDQCYHTVYINLDRSSWKFADVKKIAQAIIHFEPVLDLIIPDGLSRSNSWLDEPPGNLFIGEAKKSRSQAIAAIEDASRPWQIFRPVQERGRAHFCPLHYNSWAFVWRVSIEPIHFRELEATTVAAEAVSWTDFARLFIQAALVCRSSQKLQDIPTNHEGLRHFMSGKRPPPGSMNLGMYKSRRARG